MRRQRTKMGTDERHQKGDEVRGKKNRGRQILLHEKNGNMKIQ